MNLNTLVIIIFLTCGPFIISFAVIEIYKILKEVK